MRPVARGGSPPVGREVLGSVNSDQLLTGKGARGRCAGCWAFGGGTICQQSSVVSELTTEKCESDGVRAAGP